MAELTPLYMDISNVYSGDELGLPYRDIMGEGVVGAGDLAVSQNGAGADLSVDVAAGAAWVLGDTNPDAQPCYRVRNDATVNLGISPDASNPRKVIVVAQIVDETFAGVGRQWTLDAIHGVAAATPAEPALPDSALKLAVITVPAAASSIVTADIADSRPRAMVGSGQAVQRISGTRAAIVSTAGTTFAAGADLLSTALKLVADGVSSYRIRAHASDWSNNGVNAQHLRLNLDGADGGYLGIWNCPGASFLSPMDGEIIITPAAGLHTVNVRLTAGAGTASINGGSGGAGNRGPIVVTIERL